MSIRIPLFIISLLWALTGFAQADTLLPVKQNGKWGYINLEGRLVVKPVFEYAGDFNGLPYTKVQESGVVKIINRKGQVTSLQPVTKNNIRLTDLHFIYDTLLLIKLNNKWGLYHFRFDELFPPEYDSIYINRHWLVTWRPEWGNIIIEKNIV